MLASPTADAVERIASGERMETAIERLRAQGRRGLWALSSAARKAQGARRRRLVASMGRLPFEGAVWALRKALRAGDRPGQLGAVEGLSQIDGRASDKLLLVAATKRDREVRNAAAEALGRRVQSVRATLLARLKTKGDEALEVALIAARVGRDRSIARAALPRGLSHPIPEVVQSALRLLADQGTGEHRDRALELTRDAHGATARLAIQVLERGAARASKRGSKPAGSKDWMLELALDPAVHPQARAEVLSSLRDRRFRSFVRVLQRTPDGATRLAELGPTTEREVGQWLELSREARGPSAWPLFFAALGRAPTGGFLRVLSHLGAHPRAELPAAYLASRWPDDLDERLTVALGVYHDALTSAGALGLLIGRSAPMDRARFLPYLQHEEPVVRAAAARGLAAAGGSTDAQLIERAGTDRWVDEGLAEGGDQRLSLSFRRSLAMKLIRSDSPEARRRAVDVLAGAADPRAFSELLSVLPSMPETEQRTILDAVTSGPGSSPALMAELVTHANRDIRAAALRYIERR